MRPLLANERLVLKMSPFDPGPDAWIERTDLTPGGAPVLATEIKPDVTLETLDAKLNRLLANFGIAM